MYIYLIFGAKIIEKLHQFNPSNFKDMYSKVSIIRPGHSRLLEFEKKIVLVV